MNNLCEIPGLPEHSAASRGARTKGAANSKHAVQHFSRQSVEGYVAAGNPANCYVATGTPANCYCTGEPA